MTQRFLPAAIVLAAGLAGCSTEGGSTSSPEVTVAASDLAFCEAFSELLVGPLAEPGLDTADPEVLRFAVERTVLIVEDVRAAAPSEIAGAVEVLADGYDAGFDALAAHGYDLARFDRDATPAERAAFEAMGASPVGPAAEDPNAVLEHYFGERCAAGVTIPPDLLDGGGP